MHYFNKYKLCFIFGLWPESGAVAKGRFVVKALCGALDSCLAQNWTGQD
jgi:hypothetical protein